MFNQQVSELNLSSNYADEMFPNISGVDFYSDKSMTVTLRTLLHSRVSKEENVSARLTTTTLMGSDTKKIIDKIKDNITGCDENVLYIHSLEGTKEDNEACFKVLDELAVERVLGAEWSHMRDIEAFFGNRNVKMPVFHNEDKCITYVVIERLTVSKWHMLQSLIPRYFKKKFFESSPVTEDEKRFVKTLTLKDGYREYINYVSDFSKQFNFEEARIKTELRDFEKKFERKELENIRGSINQFENEIRQYLDRIADRNRSLRDLNIKELGLISRINGEEEGSNEIMEMFLKDKSLHLHSVNDTRLDFYFTTTVESFNPETAKKAIRNKGRSFIYRDRDGNRYNNPELTDDRIELLMTEIFVKQRMKLRVCAAYYVDFGALNYGTRGGFDFPADVLNRYIPNPHIQRFNCLGNNHETINEAMMARNYAGVIRMIWNSATNINFGDQFPCTELMKYITNPNAGKVIVLSDGTEMTPLEAAIFLEEKTKEGVA